MGWGGVNVGRQFSACFRKYFEMNLIFSVALVYCDKMSAVASLTLAGSLKAFSNLNMIIASPKKKTYINITTCYIEQKSQIKLRCLY